MEDVTVDKAALLEALQENRANHKAIFDEAMDGYAKEAEAQLQRHLDEVRAGKVKVISVHLPMPEEHTKDYDRAIKMVEMSVSNQITLTENDFAMYVMDDWAWKRQFLASNSTYSGTARASL